MIFERYLVQIGRASELWRERPLCRDGIEFWRAENMDFRMIPGVMEEMDGFPGPGEQMPASPGDTQLEPVSEAMKWQP